MRKTLERTQLIARPRAEVFDFFEDAHNLESITPPFLKFRITTPGRIEMREGARIDYKLALFGIPFGWKTRIDAYERNDHFVDRQLSGPYKTWIHTHRFLDADGGTRMTDHVEYEAPLGPIGTIAEALFVTRMVERIFDYRAEVIGKHFAVGS